MAGKEMLSRLHLKVTGVHIETRDWRGAYYRLVFTDWLFLQRDRGDSIGELAKLLWGDYNAGCAIQYKAPLDWVAHISSKHPKALEKVTRLMGDAYSEFLAELEENKDWI